MSVKITKNADKYSIEIDNGHVKALEKITSDYNIADEEKALGFVLSVIAQANGGKIETPAGVFVPSESIKKSNGQSKEQQ